MKTAKSIAEALKAPGVIPTDNTIRCIVFDGENAICHTEATLDAWWQTLSPEHKAELYEDDLERSAPLHIQAGVCRYCGCTELRACNPPCCWIDRESTVCSADPCVEQYESDREAAYESELRDAAPQVLGFVPDRIPLLGPETTDDLLAAAMRVLAAHQKLLAMPLRAHREEPAHASL